LFLRSSLLHLPQLLLLEATLVSQADFLPLVDPIADTLYRLQRQAYDDFDVHVVDPAYRLSIDAARPKAVNERILHLMEMEFGRKGKIKMIEHNDLRFLVVAGSDFDIGIRPKKLDNQWRSYQHSSLQQDELRNDGYFAFARKKTFHLFLGYRDAGEIERRMTNVAITWERTGR
jgi:hypothetical protein